MDTPMMICQEEIVSPFDQAIINIQLSVATNNKNSMYGINVPSERYTNVKLLNPDMYQKTRKIFTAFHTSLQCNVFIKCTELYSETIHTIRNEANILRTIVQRQIQKRVADHENLQLNPSNEKNGNFVTFVEAFEDESHFFVVTRAIAGVELFEFVAMFHNQSQVYFTPQVSSGYFQPMKFDVALPRHQARVIGIQICQIVENLHKNYGISHCDLSLQNFVIHPEILQVTLIDFEASRSHRLLQSSELGTLMYMSPQCIAYRETKRSYTSLSHDKFAIGVILYVLWYGCPPFEKASLQNHSYRYMHKHRKLPMENLYVHIPQLEHHYQVTDREREFFLKCFAYDVKDRADFSTFAAFLQNYQQEQEQK